MKAYEPIGLKLSRLEWCPKGTRFLADFAGLSFLVWGKSYFRLVWSVHNNKTARRVFGELDTRAIVVIQVMTFCCVFRVR